MSFNDALISLAGLENLIGVGDYLSIRHNVELTGLDALTNLASVGGVVVESNSALTNLGGLENISTIADYLRVESNAALVGLDGVDNLTSVGNLAIEDNNVLVSLDGLQSLTTVSGSVYIRYNDSLCQSLIYAFGEGVTVGGNAEIEENDESC
ncbi:MAG: hypothetical protein HN348_27000 [Proteobacteria bacterium]|nr:hypothetical protein [Pseudomonadota bacterium]